jgi:hypothetical protein
MAQIAVPAIAFAGQAIKGHKQKKMKLQEAQALRDAKNRSMAATTRELAEEERKKEFMYSRALAVAAASVAGVDDPGMVALLGDLNAEGEYRVMSKLWTGVDEAEGLNFRAEAARREGDAAWEAGLINGVTSALSSYSSMGGFDKAAPPPTSRPSSAGNRGMGPL